MRPNVKLFLSPNRWNNHALTSACVAGGALLAAHFARALSSLDPDTVDFRIFYESVRRWIAGGSLYDPSGAQINYNPPQFHVVVLPFAYLSPLMAFIAWTALNTAFAVATVFVAMSEVQERWSARDRRIIIGGVLLAAGVGATVHLGQVSWLVALLVTLGWRASRSGNPFRAGAWTGLAVALKPFVAVLVLLFVIRGSWKAVAGAFLASILSVAVGVAVFGFPSLMQWFDLLRRGAPPAQVAYFMNASWPAIVERAHAPSAFALAGMVAVLAVTAIAARGQSDDRAWLSALLCALLASPLGWIYYMPILVGPLIALAVNQRLSEKAWRIWPLLAFPCISRSFMQRPSLVAVTAGSMYAWAILGLWIVVVRSGLWEARRESVLGSRAS